ncbi:MAG: hypothetical protein DCC55_10320 [Chloroflexi bacterium]|nr:MAG: hypothetical protein DCC55_10320 [Chloroflexota bacterium]
MVENSLAHLQTGFVEKPHFTYNIANIRWTGVPIVGRARPLIWGVWSFENGEFESWSRLRTGRLGEP